MRVLCIDDSTKVIPPEDGLKAGNIYVVIDHDPCHFGCCYKLDGLAGAYKKSRFIPLSEEHDAELCEELNGGELCIELA